jgi:RNA polymerase sigma factor (sigma-70 family)
MALSHAANLALVARFQDGDEQAGALLCEVNTPLVAQLARRCIGPGVELDDLMQAGMIGICVAAQRFDPGKGCQFSTYATYWIRQAIAHTVSAARPIRWPVGAKEGPAVVVSLDQPAGDGDARIGDWIRAPDTEPAIVARVAVAQLLPLLPPHEREVIERRYGIGRPEETLRSIGEELGASHQQISNIQARALARLREAVR